MKKRIIIVALALLGFSTLTGCGGKGNKTNSDSGSDLRTKPTTDFTIFKRKF